MEHTFFFLPGHWQLIGKFFTMDGGVVPVGGKTLITHESDKWISHSIMTVMDGDSEPIETHYAIRPFHAGETITSWKSRDSKYGDFFGTFALIDDTILSHITSATGEFHGTEFFMQITDSKYVNRGMMFHDGKKASAWAMFFIRE